MKRVYIAGPIGDPLTNNQVAENVGRAIDAGRRLIRAGLAPFVPHFSAFYPGAFQIGHATWMEVDLAWVAVSDMVLRLPGKSPGADREVYEARRLNIPVYDNIEVLIAEHMVVPF